MLALNRRPRQVLVVIIKCAVRIVAGGVREDVLGADVGGASKTTSLHDFV